MANNLIELTPVEYSESAVKVLYFEKESQRESFRLHWHDRMEIIRVRSGKFYVDCGTETVISEKGGLIVIPPKILHRGCAYEESVTYDVLMFDVRSFYNETEICKKMLPPIFDGRAVFKNYITDSETVCCFDKICSEKGVGALETTANIYKLLDLFYKKSLLELRDQPKNSSVKKIVDFIEENFVNEIDNAVLCEQFGYTASHLCRKFKQTTGLTPMMYLKIYRLENAKEKLKNRDCSISRIAAECGFSDANYFTRCFKAHFGVSPIKYIKQATVYD